jgi:hypothetical protein
MRKTFSTLGLLVAVILVFSLVGAGCKKGGHKGPLIKYGFQLSNENFKKGGIGFILTAKKNENAIALKKTDRPFRNLVTIKGQIKTALSSGAGNSRIVFGENPGQLSSADIFVGPPALAIQGPMVEKVQLPATFAPEKILDVDLTINIKEGTVAWKVDGVEIAAPMKAKPAAISYIGYGVMGTGAEFSELQITGD